MLVAISIQVFLGVQALTNRLLLLVEQLYKKKTNEAITDKLHSRLVSGFVVSGPYLQFPMPITQICFCMNYALMHDMKLPR